MPKSNLKVVNKKTRSVDGHAEMMGRPVYTDDYAAHGALVCRMLRSPHAFAHIKNIDTSKAEALNGVKCVLTYKNVPHVAMSRAGQGAPAPSPIDKFILDEYVRYVGDEVALVAAINEQIAEDALKLIEVEYEVLEPVLDYKTAYQNK
ncbi:MAG TPA: aldehyde oxidase, partial [Bacilli bacterium]|nr:aldehyde oxidase [Bacilli bacterium]